MAFIASFAGFGRRAARSACHCAVVARYSKPPERVAALRRNSREIVDGARASRRATARLCVLFVLIVLAHHRRRVVHFNVTEHPTAAWTVQQIVDAFPDESAPAYLLLSSATAIAPTVSHFGTA